MRPITLSLVTATATIFAVVFLLAQEHGTATKPAPKSPMALILQDDDGDHLVHRAGPLGGVPFTIKVDSQFVNPEDFFVFAEALAPGQVIPFHKHHNAEELLLFEEAGAQVVVGNKSGNAGPHSLVFIPRHTWISAVNTSRSPIHLMSIFSRPGFETYMRAISAKPGESLKPLRQDELTRLRSLGHATYWDTS